MGSKADAELLGITLGTFGNPCDMHLREATLDKLKQAFGMGRSPRFLARSLSMSSILEWQPVPTSRDDSLDCRTGIGLSSFAW